MSNDRQQISLMAGGTPHFQLWLERDPVCGTVCSVKAIK